MIGFDPITPLLGLAKAYSNASGAIPEYQRPSYGTTLKRRRTDTGYATKGYVKRIASSTQENKYKEISAAYQEIPYDAAMVLDCSAISQGDTVNTREGDFVQPTGMQCGIRVQNDYSDDAMYRLVLFQWHMDDTPVETDILPIDGAAFSGYDMLSTYNFDGRKKFTVLYDTKTKILGNTTSDENVPSIRVHQFHVKKKMRKIQFNGAATTGRNKIYLLAFSNRATALNAVYIDYNIDLFWKE